MKSESVISQYAVECVVKFFIGGEGPTHQQISSVFTRIGYQDGYDWNARENDTKVVRIQKAFLNFQSDESKIRTLLNGIIGLLRAKDLLGGKPPSKEEEDLKGALAECNWELKATYEVRRLSITSFETGGRAALDDALYRLQHADGDSALQVGTAKEIIESILKYILQEIGTGVPKNAKFPYLKSLAMERLGMLPKKIDISKPGGKNLRSLYSNVSKDMDELDQIRNLVGTGHGRTDTYALSSQDTVFIIKETGLIAELLLTRLDVINNRATVKG
ncbi:abortive infection family protein [Bifidobacterium aquikefiri]|uniref:abortive infection family protein n=1 Tax=Bifidobacterium aquikefiri TaxID=1653207 RepID=UPI0039ED1369